MTDFMRLLVHGNTWKCRMVNGAVFAFWTPLRLTRREARIELMRVANGSYDDAYTTLDIESIWRTS